MRTIKFRAWDKIEGKMWTPMIDVDGVPCARHPVSQVAMRMDGELLDPVMQFTGLLDKNGVEIYEGDITRQIRKDNCFGRADITEIVTIGEPEWTELGSMDSGGPDGNYPLIEIEVIGNIYESV